MPPPYICFCGNLTDLLLYSIHFCDIINKYNYYKERCPMKLAVYTVSLPEYDLAESVAVLKEMGYEGVEWRVDKTVGGEVAG